MIKRTEGIVLKNFPYGDADLIVTYITRDFGILKVFAKSPRKTKSRFGSSLEPLTYSKISFIGKEDVNLPRLTQSDIIKPFQSLREDFKCLYDISEIIKIFLAFHPERDGDIGAFKFFLDMLSQLESSPKKDILYLYYKLKMLEISGYLPMLQVCGICESDIMNSESFDFQIDFYPSHGSIICKRCINRIDNSIKVSRGALIFQKSVIRWNPSSIDRIKAPEIFISELSNIINVHVSYLFNSKGK